MNIAKLHRRSLWKDFMDQGHFHAVLKGVWKLNDESSFFLVPLQISRGLFIVLAQDDTMCEPALKG